MVIAVLALQGAFLEHEILLKKLGIEYIEIRKKADALKKYDGLIIPGGESTVQGKLLYELEIYDILKNKIENGLPVFGTCAGLILLANKITNDNHIYFGTMEIEVVRNAFGRQLGSFSINGEFNNKTIPMVFIRAPYIKSLSDKCSILGEVNGKIVAARCNNQLVTAFHPELTDDLTVFNYFIEMVNNYKNNS